MKKIFYDMSNADYHAHSAISKSGLDKIAISPAHYLAYKQGQTKRTDALDFGGALHDFILLPETFSENHIVLPEDFNARLKVSQEQLKKWEADSKNIVKHSDFEKIQAMAQSVKAHQSANSLLQNGRPEVSVFWHDDETGEECRCRPDYWNMHNIIVDLKTTQDSSPHGFAKSIANYRYHVQAAFYMHGVYSATGQYPKGFVFVAIEKEPPYAVGVYTLDDNAIALGRELYQRDLRTLHEAKKSQQWQAYNPKIETLSLPAWAFNI